MISYLLKYYSEFLHLIFLFNLWYFNIFWFCSLNLTNWSISTHSFTQGKSLKVSQEMGSNELLRSKATPKVSRTMTTAAPVSAERTVFNPIRYVGAVMERWERWERADLRRLERSNEQINFLPFPLVKFNCASLHWCNERVGLNILY